MSVSAEPRLTRRNSGRHRRAGPQSTRLLACGAAVVVIVVLQVVTWFVLRRQGWLVGGDSPSYVLMAQSLAHFTLNPLPALSSDQLTHTIFSWPTTGVPASALGHSFLGPHGYVFAQGLGVPLLLAPFMLVGGEPLALLAFFAVIAAGFVFLHQRASELLSLNTRGQVLLGVAMAAPALFMASTQVYPDLLSGVFLACALIELVRIERTRQFPRVSVVVMTIGLSTVSWFQIKNLAPVVVIVVALALCSVRARGSWTPFYIITGVTAASVVLLFAYNLFYFGRLLGLPEAGPVLHHREIENILALVFDRHQGFLVQVPTTALGLLGLWISRRSNPLSNLSAVIGIGFIILINGTQPTANFMGGTALAGRFQWTIVPILLVWSAFLIKKLERSTRTIAVLTAIVVVLWVLQGVLVAWGHHVLVNSLISPFAPFDPALYPGWWGWLNHYLPSFLVSGWGVGTLAELLFFGGLAVLLLSIARDPDSAGRGGATGRAGPIAGVALMVLSAVVAVAGTGSSLPSAPLTSTESQIGGPWTTGQSSTAYPPAQLTEISAGTYVITVSYQLASAQSRPSALSVVLHPPEALVVSGWFSPFHFADAAAVQVSSAQFTRAQQHVASVLPLVPSSSAPAAAPLRVTSSSFVATTTETLSLQMTVASASTLHVPTITIRKLH